MIIYVKQTEKVQLMHKLLNLFKLEHIEDKVMVYLPINKNTRKRKLEKVLEKLSKFLYNNNIKNVVLEQSLMENETAKNILYSNNINILDGLKIPRFMVCDAIQKIYKYKGKKIEAGEVTLLVNDNNDINTQTINMLAQNIKRLNIITNNIKKYRRIVDYLYNELGILIKLSNNLKTNLKSTDIIVNIDFPEEIVNKIDIPNNAIILNLQENININSKKFSGINIKSWEIEVPNNYRIDGFESKIVYEASLYQKSTIQIIKQIQNDNIKIKKFIGVNGEINSEEFKKIYLTKNVL